MGQNMPIASFSEKAECHGCKEFGGLDERELQ
jgi:hypothetical protein